MANANRVHRRLGRTSLHCVLHRSIDGRYRPVHAVAQVVKIKKTSGQRIDMPRDDPSGHGDLSLLPRGGARGDPISDNMQRAEWKGEEGRGSAEGRGGRTWGAPLDMGSLGGRQPQISKHSRNITTSIIKFGRNVGWEGPRQQASHGQPASHQASQQASHPGLLRSSVFGLLSSIFCLRSSVLQCVFRCVRGALSKNRTRINTHSLHT